VNVQYIDGPAPFLRGGVIATGTYTLVKYEVYFSGTRGTGETAETIVVTGSPVVGAIASVREVRNTTGEVVPVVRAGASSTFQTYGSTPSMELSQQCPGQQRSPSVTYQASSAELALFDSSTSVYRVYRRVP
jgi:hypothetical protein